MQNIALCHVTAEIPIDDQGPLISLIQQDAKSTANLAIANEFCHDLGAHAHGLPQNKVQFAPATECSPATDNATASKQHTIDF